MALEKVTMFVPDCRFYEDIPALNYLMRNNVNSISRSDLDKDPSLGADLKVACWAGHAPSPVADYLSAGKLPNLKLIVLHGVGYNHLPFSLLKEKNVRVSNTPGVLSDSTADMAMTLMLASARQLVKGEASSQTECDVLPASTFSSVSAKCQVCLSLI